MDDGITKNSPTSDRTQEEPNDLEGLVADTLSKWNHEDGSKKPNGGDSQTTQKSISPWLSFGQGLVMVFSCFDSKQ